jgi:hypothetical protein
MSTSSRRAVISGAIRCIGGAALVPLFWPDAQASAAAPLLLGLRIATVGAGLRAAGAAAARGAAARAAVRTAHGAAVGRSLGRMGYRPIQGLRANQAADFLGVKFTDRPRPSGHQFHDLHADTLVCTRRIGPIRYQLERGKRHSSLHATLHEYYRVDQEGIIRAHKDLNTAELNLIEMAERLGFMDLSPCNYREPSKDIPVECEAAIRRNYKIEDHLKPVYVRPFTDGDKIYAAYAVEDRAGRQYLAVNLDAPKES